jgi:hypothetical protein
MEFENFSTLGYFKIKDAYCTNKKCKTKPELFEVSNGFLSRAWYCPDCESIYLLKLEKHDKRKVGIRFLEKCRREYKIEIETNEFVKQLRKKYKNY